MNVYLIEDDGGGVTVFDAGVKSMANAIAAAASALGGINRVVLGHAHVDHRGAAPGLGAPVFCHPADRADAEGDGGRHYVDFSKLRPYARPGLPAPARPLGRRAGRDRRHGRGGRRRRAASASSTCPATRPGMIALFRERDGVALTTDCFYTLDIQTGAARARRASRTPRSTSTPSRRARRSASSPRSRPSAAWPGHAEPLTGDVAAQLERAAATS